jgi:hypothetical protein
MEDRPTDASSSWFPLSNLHYFFLVVELEKSMKIAVDFSWYSRLEGHFSILELGATANEESLFLRREKMVTKRSAEDNRHGYGGG